MNAAGTELSCVLVPSLPAPPPRLPAAEGGKHTFGHSCVYSPRGQS